MIDVKQLLFNNTPGTTQDACVSTYTLVEGTLAIPVMDVTAVAPVVVRVHAPYTTRKSRFEYTRTGSPPIIPAPGNASWYNYLGGNISVGAPATDSRGAIVYSVAGMYEFVGVEDLRNHGKIRFDAHGALSQVDFLGYNSTFPEENIPNALNSWPSPYFDLTQLGSARILG